MGVASVALLWDAVRRPFGEAAGLIAGVVLALTPVAVTIFRYNNPDALLVLLMIAAVWALLRAVDDGRLRWLLLCGGCLGLGYLTKQLEVALVMPALALGYLLAGPRSVLDRIWRLVLTLGAALAAAGWWVLLVQLWPTDRRPWIGGTQHNSILELTLGYNGIGRLNGDEPGSVGALGVSSPIHLGGRTAAHPWGQPGIGRLFEAAQIGCIGWLLPAALVFGLALLVWQARAPRRDPQRAAILVWTAWLLTTALVFSFMAGIFHPYYTVALAPPIAALVGIGTAQCLAKSRKALGQSHIGTGGGIDRGHLRAGAEQPPGLPPMASVGRRRGRRRSAVLAAPGRPRIQPTGRLRRTRRRSRGGTRWPDRLQPHHRGARQLRFDADRGPGAAVRDGHDQGRRPRSARRDHGGQGPRLPASGRGSRKSPHTWSGAPCWNPECRTARSSTC